MGKKSPKKSPKKVQSPPKCDKVSSTCSSKASADDSQKKDIISMSPKAKDDKPVDAVQTDTRKTEFAPLKYSNKIDVLTDNLLDLLESEYYVAEHDKALAAYELCEAVLIEQENATTRQLLDHIVGIGTEIGSKIPHETTARNIIYKVRKIIVDEYLSAINLGPEMDCARTFFKSVTSRNTINVELPELPPTADPVEVGQKVRDGAIASMVEYRTELDNIPNAIANVGQDLILGGDKVLTYSYCPNLAQVFLNAAQNCEFTLYVAESSPLSYGHLMADALSGSSVKVILVRDVNVADLMPSITKVIIPCIAVLPPGDLRTVSFGGVIAAIGSRHKKPVYAVAASYQFSLSSVVNNTNVLLSPYIVDNNPSVPGVSFVTTKFDITKNNHVYTIVTNAGHIEPKHTWRQLTELYTPKQEKVEIPDEPQLRPYYKMEEESNA